MRATLAAFSKASRAPLTSKQGNKEFYKGHNLSLSLPKPGPATDHGTLAGTGSMPGLGPKRQGRYAAGSKAPYILMRERMRTFVVPQGLDSSDVSPESLLVAPAIQHGRSETP